jgi:hypothetical protein
MPVRPTIHKRRILRTVQQHLPFGWKLHDEVGSGVVVSDIVVFRSDPYFTMALAVTCRSWHALLSRFLPVTLTVPTFATIYKTN